MYKEGACLYHNPLRSVSDVKDWRMEGGGQISFDDHSLHLSQSFGVRKPFQTASL
ncbi:hypothetical protein J5TS4_39280 [Bacillus sp. J5TS4]|nr:hypothetical protein J5TS4_39280 [Bacillus sp. J5TS4]